MNSKTLLKVNRFGKVGKIVMTVLMIAAIITAVLNGAAAIYTATLPKDAVKVAVTNNAEFKINESYFSTVWNFLFKGVSFSANDDPSAMIKGDDSEVLPGDNTVFSGELKFFNQSYSSAALHSEKGEKIIDAKSSPSEYSSSDLSALFIFTTLFCASVAVALLMLQRLFKVLSVCESPFCGEFVSKLRTLGYSLIPVALFASVGETFAVRFLSAGRDSSISVQWGILVAFGVIMCLVTVFRYGVQLQKESDETL